MVCRVDRGSGDTALIPKVRFTAPVFQSSRPKADVHQGTGSVDRSRPRPIVRSASGSNGADGANKSDGKKQLLIVKQRQRRPYLVNSGIMVASSPYRIARPQ